MTFATSDWIVVFLYFVVTLALGFGFARRAGGGLADYFLAGRRAPWWLAGTGMVATTFAADTPLWVAGQVAQHGIAGNWLWWSQAAGGMLTVFFFARLWSRAGVLTDVEFLELRYDGNLRHALRIFKSAYFGLFLNCIIIAWVNLAMLKILRILLPGANAELILCVLAASVTLYVMFAGLWGVAAADMFQFSVAMIGCVILAIFALQAPALQSGGGLEGMLPKQAFSFLPDFSGSAVQPSGTGASDAGQSGGFHLSFLAFAAFVFVQWWSAWYPGAEPGGGGYVAQRIMSARSEREGLLSALWFVVANYCLRSWPWIIAGLAAAALYSKLPPGQSEEGFVYLMRDVLPAPLGGLLFAAFLGAYMSTLSTQLNWGGSYLINDFYRPYLAKERSQEHYVLVSRWTAPFLVVPALLVTFFVLQTIHGAWAFLIEVGAGTGFVLIVRWYWWRVNAAAEFASLVGSALLAVAIKFLLPWALPGNALVAKMAEFPYSLYVLTAGNIVITLAVVFLSRRPSADSLVRFFLRALPPGPGWRYVEELCREKGIAVPPRTGHLGRQTLGWMAGTALVYCLLFGIGAVLFGRWELAAVLLLGAVFSALATWRIVHLEFAGER